MADNFKVKFNNSGFLRKMEKAIKTIEDLPRRIGGQTARLVGDSVVRNMKNLITNGTSPIKGQGRYKPYTKAYADRKGVNRRDVDLTLSGEMLKSLRAKPDSFGGSTVGYMTRIGRERNEYNVDNGRETIPQRNDTLKQKVLSDAEKLYLARIKRILDTIDN